MTQYWWFLTRSNQVLQRTHALEAHSLQLCWAERPPAEGTVPWSATWGHFQITIFYKKWLQILGKSKFWHFSNQLILKQPMFPFPIWLQMLSYCGLCPQTLSKISISLQLLWSMKNLFWLQQLSTMIFLWIRQMNYHKLISTPIFPWHQQIIH